MSHWHERTKQHTLTLVRWPSINGTADETEFAYKLHALFAQLPYFQTHPDHVWLQRTLDDAHERYNVIAMVRGRGDRAVALAGHYDTVGVDDYGALAPFAGEPDALLPRLMDDLRGRADAASQHALADLESGDFLPGRAALDMKSGIAAGMAVLEHFAGQIEREGTLLLMATPDEEGSSAGMRSAAAALPAWLRRHDLSLEAVINLDATNDTGDGSAGRSIYLGSTGKQLASILFVGHAAHTGNPFAGVSASFLAAQFAREIDYNPEYGDVLNGDPAPPPVTLRLRDGKQAYDVTTPQTAWCAVNVLSHRRTPQHVMADVVRAAQCAMDVATCEIERRAQRSGIHAPRWQPRVMTYAELRARVLAQADDATRRGIVALESHATRQGDPFDWLRRDQQAVEALWVLSGLGGPAAVVCAAAPFYPLVTLDETRAKGARLMRAIQRAASAVEAETHLPIALRRIFLGVSDMSFFAPPAAEDDKRALIENAPTLATRAHIAGSLAPALDAPIVNIGPWGRDYHQRTERLYMPYAFDVVPELVWRVAGDVLRACDNTAHG